MKKILMMFAVMVVVGMVAGSAFAEEAMVNGICWRYSVSDKSARIEGFGDMPAKNGMSAEECTQKMLGKVVNKSLTIPGKIGSYTVTSIGENAIMRLDRDGPSSITVPASVMSIDARAFAANNNLRTVTLPPKLMYIPDGLFEACPKLTSVRIPLSVRTIGCAAFSGCRNLNTVIIPASVTRVEEGAFAYCSKLAKIDVAKGCRSYKSVGGALYTKDGTTLVTWPAGSSTAAVSIPDGVTSIGTMAFCGNGNLKSVALPASVTSIGRGAFLECYDLESVTLPPNLTKISNILFADCRKLTSVNIPPSVKTIELQAFHDCVSIETITIPEGVEQIEREAFHFCTNLASVTIPASVTHIGEGAFRWCDKLGKIDVAEGSRAYKSIDGALYSKDGTTLVAWPDGNPAAAVTVPDGVTIIKDGAFSSPAITSITLPKSVATIEDMAFYGTKLEVIYAQPGDLDRLKALIAVHKEEAGKSYISKMGFCNMKYRDRMEKVKVEERKCK